VNNGLTSPLCEGSLGGGELTQSDRRHCETSGFVAAPAPTGNYGLDVHIETGFLGLSTGTLLSVVQDLLVAPLWMALVWAMHALVVMLEWSFTIDLLDSASSAGLGRGLQAMQSRLTDPWLAFVLAVAAVLALYNGLFRRRVAETVGQTLVMGLMMAGGIWLIADPSATVGALGGWANQASLGALAVVARGTPAQPGRALGETMSGAFSAAIEGPWCYLEFGDVAWCRDPSRLETRLRTAARAVAAREMARVGCTGGSTPLGPCVAASSAQARSVLATARLLREADTNGAMFLALPPNGPARNAISESSSLLSAICQSSEATGCRGPAAAEAEFRTDGGTWPRVAGLMLILAGALGMLLLLGFIALRLLAAALFSLLCLLVAPGMVLAPAFGEPGRALFRRWAVQLIGAVVSKLVFSFLLGVVLAAGAILYSLDALGWWTQWLLLSAFWWTAYNRRHQALGFAHEAVGSEHRRGPGPIRRLTSAVDSTARALHSGRRAKDALARKRTETAEEQRPTQATQTMQDARTGARAPMAGGTPQRPEDRRGDEAAIAVPADEQSHPGVGGAGRASHLAREQEPPAGASAGERTGTGANAGAGHDPEQAAGEDGARRSSQASRDHIAAPSLGSESQSPAPGEDGPRGAGGPGGHAALAGLAGMSRPEREALDPAGRQAARSEIDRELAQRREMRGPPERPAAPARERGTQDGAASQEGSLGDGDPGAEEEWGKRVMRDAREVAAGRKRRLGFDQD